VRLVAGVPHAVLLAQARRPVGLRIRVHRRGNSIANVVLVQS
jgi:hypothetical protein